MVKDNSFLILLMIQSCIIAEPKGYYDHTAITEISLLQVLLQCELGLIK